MQLINPAYAGAEADNMVSFVNRTQWAILEDSPRTMAFAYPTKRKNNLGLGLSVVTDKIFVERQTFTYVDFSYRLDMDDNKIFLGLKAGGNFYRSSSIELEDYNTSIDPAQKGFSRFNPNIGAGVFVQNDNYWIAFSIPRLFNVRRDDDITIGAKDRIHSYLGGGLNYALGENFVLKPALMLRKGKALPLSADISTFISFQNKVDFGLAYRTSAAFSFMTLVNVTEGIDVGYAYETPTNQELSGQGIKTHEIFFKIKITKDKYSLELTESNK